MGISSQNGKLSWAGCGGISLRRRERILRELLLCAQESLSLLKAEERTGSPQGGHRADKHGRVLPPLRDETQTDVEKRHSAVHRVG